MDRRLRGDRRRRGLGADTVKLVYVDLPKDELASLEHIVVGLAPVVRLLGTFDDEETVAEEEGGVGEGGTAPYETPEQLRVCRTCKHERMDEGLPCDECHGFDKWTPKEGED